MTDTTKAEIDRIVGVCARYWGHSMNKVYGPSRNGDLTPCRHVAMYLVRKRLGIGFIGIGVAFNRDHSSVQYAVKKINKLLEDDEFTQRVVKELEELLQQEEAADKAD